MAKPQILVNSGDSFTCHFHALFTDGKIKFAKELQGAVIFLPKECQAVLSVTTGHMDNQFVIGRTVESPVIVDDHIFNTV